MAKAKKQLTFHARCSQCEWQGELARQDVPRDELVVCPDCGSPVTPVPMDSDAEVRPAWEKLREEITAEHEKNSLPAHDESYGQEKSVLLFTTEMWKGVKVVFKCSQCGTFRDDQDGMVEHILLHYPANEQEKIFNQLVKEK